MAGFCRLFYTEKVPGFATVKIDIKSMSSGLMHLISSTCEDLETKGYNTVRIQANKLRYREYIYFQKQTF